MPFQWANPYFLLLLLILPALAFHRRRRRDGSVVFPSLALASRLRPSLRGRLRAALLPVRAASLALLVVALARPQWGRADDALPGQGIDIVVAMDVSYSMLEGDMGKVNKLEAAKRAAQDFLRERKEDRIGLVIFGGRSLTYSPLTTDYNALQDIVGRIDGGSLGGGTAIGMGVAEAVNLLRDSRAKSRVVVLLSDGENNAGSVSPLQAAQIAKLLKVKVYTVGVFSGEEILGRGTSQARLRVDEEILKRVGEMTEGAYFRAASEDTMKGIYRYIEALEKSRLESKRYAGFEELGPYLLLTALLLVTVEVSLANTVLRQFP